MKKEHQGWSHSAHRNWAVCADCHVSQKSLVTKLAGKVRDGLNHGYAYVFDSAPDPIRIKRYGAATVMENYLRCHGQFVANFRIRAGSAGTAIGGQPHGY